MFTKGTSCCVIRRTGLPGAFQALSGQEPKSGSLPFQSFGVDPIEGEGVLYHRDFAARMFDQEKMICPSFSLGLINDDEETITNQEQLSI